MTAFALLLIGGGVLLVWAGVTDANIAEAITNVVSPS